MLHTLKFQTSEVSFNYIDTLLNICELMFFNSNTLLYSRLVIRHIMPKDRTCAKGGFKHTAHIWDMIRTQCGEITLFIYIHTYYFAYNQSESAIDILIIVTATVFIRP